MAGIHSLLIMKHEVIAIVNEVREYQVKDSYLKDDKEIGLMRDDMPSERTSFVFKMYECKTHNEQFDTYAELKEHIKS